MKGHDCERLGTYLPNACLVWLEYSVLKLSLGICSTRLQTNFDFVHVRQLLKSVKIMQIKISVFIITLNIIKSN